MKKRSKIVIVGGGIIGCEFACFFGSLGIPVTVIEMLDEILPMIDGDLAGLFKRKMKAEGQSLRETLNSPLFRNRTVEVSLLGDMASFRVGHNDGKPPLLTSSEENPPQQLEWSGDNQVHELTELARLLKSGLITLDEYEQAKQKLIDKLIQWHDKVKLNHDSAFKQKGKDGQF